MSFNESQMARYVGGTSQPFGVLIANKQMAALDVQYYWAVIFMFVLTVVCLEVLSLALQKRRHKGVYENAVN
jgi:lipopolysaccharide export LptBFGC system permease protein LptF